ncbi:hypothetical protein [Massilia sp. YMA4]|uniref:hypothetical protein n=1 Tax=Massilia sp. YMA4 TaxID=1593482 RepID=UPI001582D61D|nr:hypothetical protein [Massilia sp. YMA4]
MTSKLQSIFTLPILTSLLLTGCGGGDDSDQAKAPLIPPLAQTEVVIGPASQGAQMKWPDRSTINGGAGKTLDGVGCLLNEDYHIHAHLTIIYNGETLRIPKNIGLTGCAYELHTHDWSGVLHVETDRQKQFTLGQFYSVWGMPLSRKNVAYLQSDEIRFFRVNNGRVAEYLDDPVLMPITAGESIIIVIGPLPPTLPRYTWSGQ